MVYAFSGHSQHFETLERDLVKLQASLGECARWSSGNDKDTVISTNTRWYVGPILFQNSMSLTQQPRPFNDAQ